MKHDLEAILFATEAPLGVARLRGLLPDATPQEVRRAIAELQAEYDREERAFTIVEFGGGWQIATRPEYAPLIHRLYGGRRHLRLSKASLEVLAIVAYRQPLTRMAIEEIRGVQSASVLATLLERNLVTVVGRADTVGHPILYGTTREFLDHLGLQNLAQLPPLPDVAGVIGNREEFMQFALQLGQEIEESDLTAWTAEPEAEATPAADGAAVTPAPGEGEKPTAAVGDFAQAQTEGQRVEPPDQLSAVLDGEGRESDEREPA